MMLVISILVEKSQVRLLYMPSVDLGTHNLWTIAWVAFVARRVSDPK